VKEKKMVGSGDTCTSTSTSAEEDMLGYGYIHDVMSGDCGILWAVNFL
jgi:hypothetical protein